MEHTALNKEIPMVNPNETQNYKVSDEKYIKTLHFKNDDLKELHFKSFVWELNDFHNLSDKEYSPEFSTDDLIWRVLIFPRGNTQQKQTISLYVDNLNVKDDLEIEKLNKNIKQINSVCSKFVMFVSNPSDDTIHIYKTATHRFTKDESDWGFTSFSDIRSLAPVTEIDKETSKASIKITVYLQVLEDPTGVLWHNFINYDSKETTGYVGLKNQGATCYMNSLLQTLYFIKPFRKAVYQIPTTNIKTNKIPLSLQKMFYRLKISSDYVDTSELIKSFGWHTTEAFMQHDVQEFNKILMDNLENCMKNTQAEKTIQKLFSGKMKSFIKCINVEYESSRVEEFSDIQLNVKNFNTIEESLVDYCKTEVLDGDNKYMAGDHGLQDAEKGVMFETLPPVLQLHLMRYAYDFETDTMVKINDRYEYPEVLDFKDYLSKSDDMQNTQYILHGVLVHSGDINGGHYYALIKPEAEDKWFKFDDEKVIPVTKKEVFEENFGGNSQNINRAETTPHFKKRADYSTNAYMLVYYNKSYLDEILDEDYEIPQHIMDLSENQIHTKNNSNMEKALENITYHITTKNDFIKHQGIDLVDIDTVMFNCSMKINIGVKSSLAYLVEQISKQSNIPTDKMRLWEYTKRPNKTLRPDKLLDFEKNKDSIALHFGKTNCKFLLFLEDIQSIDIKKGFFKETSIMVFLKYYDEFSNGLRFVDSFYVMPSNKIFKYSAEFILSCNLNANTPIDLYEESGIDLTTPKKLANESFKVSEISNGDIIVLCKQSEQVEKSLKSYYKDMDNLVNITFCNKEDETASFVIKLDKRNDYNSMAQCVSQHLSKEANKIQFTLSNNGIEHHPGNVIRASDNHSILKILSMQKSNLVYYQDVGTDIYELQNKVNVSILWTKSLSNDKIILTSISKDATVGELIELLKKENIQDQQQFNVLFGENSFLFGSRRYRYYKTFNEHDSVDEFNKCDIIHIENLDINIKEAQKEDIAILPVFHCVNNLYSAGLSPCFIVLEKSDSNKDIKTKITKKLGISDKYCTSLAIGIDIDDEIRKLDDDEDNYSEVIFQNKKHINHLVIQHPKKIKRKSNDGAIRFK